MNMRRYYQLLNLRRSTGLYMSHRRCVHQTSSVEPHHLCRHPQPPTPPQPRSIFSSYGHISRNTYSRRNAIGSYSLLQSTLNSKHYSSQVTVKGREVISAAATPAYEHWLTMSNLDLLLPPIEAGVFFCYKKKKNANMSPETVVDTIKKSLAGVLSTYYPLAGEIVQNSQGEPEVVCNNSGVEFVHAHADVELKDLDFYHPDHSVSGKLVPQINRGLLSVQVSLSRITRFKTFKIVKTIRGEGVVLTFTASITHNIQSSSAMSSTIIPSLTTFFVEMPITHHTPISI
ncbi:putative alcohol O-acetyltransferase [Helianthus annuus]|nr:putative alcohol O-acetyltransferase [Helianthus annuus]KAJ0541323.1 putative alcohol O-acetyltransferase [Helianthus annuus]KAJ0706402.1 putative alcohol O-acetyltransferase [Helianthus annuus]KAJ0710441.1 putative alcohol O-acetyltransferase [Helianthus annuus]KAJ0886938.1 putative alcohol O-acetyltransferase [Helianthus annuus]